MENLEKADKKAIIDNIEQKIQQVFDSRDCFINKEEFRIQLGPLWHTSEQLNSSLKIIEDFLNKNKLIEKCTTIAIADTLKSQFTIFPHACILAHKYNKSLIIWKERAEYLRGRDIIFGDVGLESEKILILQDIILGGYTIVKLLVDLQRLKKNSGKKIENIDIATLIKLMNDDSMNNLIKLINEQASDFQILNNNFTCLLDLSNQWSEVFK